MSLIKVVGIVILTIPTLFSSSSPYLIVEGNQVEFSLQNQEAFIKNASIEYQGLFFYSSYLVFKEGEIFMENARFTTCDLTPPHYRLDVGFLRLPLMGDKRKIYIKKASLYLGNRKMFSLPPLRIPIDLKEREKENILNLPRVEFSKDFGVSLVSEMAFSRGEDNGRIKIGYSTKKEFFGKISYPLSHSTTLYIGKYEVISGKEISPVYINEEPHLNWQRNNFSFSLGRFTEEPTNQQSNRARFSLLHTLLQRRTKNELLYRITAKGSYSLYDSNRKYRTVGGEISLTDEKKTSKTTFSLGYLSISGSTPFYFDRDELPYYANLDLLRDGNNWKWEIEWMWDLKKRRLYDAQITVYRKLHCLQPGISWQKRGGIFQFKLKLAGF